MPVQEELRAVAMREIASALAGKITGPLPLSVKAVGLSAYGRAADGLMPRQMSQSK